MTENTITVKCPNCRKKIEWVASNQFRPFCSKRCKMIDLGAWASEDYFIESSESDNFSEEN